MNATVSGAPTITSITSLFDMYSYGALLNNTTSSAGHASLFNTAYGVSALQPVILQQQVVRLITAATSPQVGPQTQTMVFMPQLPGATNNYAAVFANGNVGIGETTPDAKLHVVGTVTTSGAGAIAGIFTEHTMNNSTGSGFQYGNRSISTISSSTAGTHVGQFIRMIDNTSLDSGQNVRGLEVQAFSGTNVNGANTGIASFWLYLWYSGYHYFTGCSASLASCYFCRPR
ncbi:hypothetical protein IPM19_00040 [bacterium]|nr:MAG: hypothetical protein IPM19_00040 [bacterium]